MAEATVIDELVVTLGLDASKFTEGQKKAVEAASKTVERLRDFAKDAEASGSRAAEFFGKIKTQAVGLFTALAGAESIEHFIADVTNSDSALYRFSRTIGKATGEVSAWDLVFKKFTGDAGHGVELFDRIAKASQQMLLHGDTSWFVTLNRMLKSVDLNATIQDLVDNNGNIKNTTELVERMVHAFSELKRRGQESAARGFAEALGLNDQQLFVLEQGDQKIKSTLADMIKLAAINDQMGAQSQHLAEQWNRISAEVGRSLRDLWYNILSPFMRAWDYIHAQTNEGVPIPGMREQFDEIGRSVTRPYDNIMSDLYGVPRTNLPPGGGGGASMPLPPLGAITGGTDTTGGVRTKAGAGTPSVSTLALAQVLQAGIPDFNRVTAYEDELHRGWASAHNEGRAVDFTIGNRGNAEATAGAIRAKLAAMGIDASVLNEYNRPSRNATAGHIHVQFNSADAARRFTEMSRGGRVGGGGGDVNIGTINVNAPNATDANGIAADIRGAIQRNSFGQLANGGHQ